MPNVNVHFAFCDLHISGQWKQYCGITRYAKRHIFWQYAMATTDRLVYVKGENSRWVSGKDKRNTVKVGCRLVYVKGHGIEHCFPIFVASCECHNALMFFEAIWLIT
uniref:Uncharacterized protein n=1 Tax=Cacopsylla melanoneura TaxID=428564 RepID=A0A8D9A8W3_9HEMI